MTAISSYKMRNVIFTRNLNVKKQNKPNYNLIGLQKKACRFSISNFQVEYRSANQAKDGPRGGVKRNVHSKTRVDSLCFTCRNCLFPFKKMKMLFLHCRRKTLPMLECLFCHQCSLRIQLFGPNMIYAQWQL